MNLADSMQGGDDSFKLLLNYKNRHTFTQEPCVYDGEKRFVYDVMFGRMDYFIVAKQDAKREAVFDAFDKFLENMLRYTTAEENPYTAVLLYTECEKLEPVLTIDHTGYAGSQTVVLIFGLRGEMMVLGYSGVDLNEKLRRAFSEKVDLAKIRGGSESTVRGVFGDHELAMLIPPEETKTDGNTGDCAGGRRDVDCCGAGCGGPGGSVHSDSDEGFECAGQPEDRQDPR